MCDKRNNGISRIRKLVDSTVGFEVFYQPNTKGHCCIVSFETCFQVQRLVLVLRNKMRLEMRNPLLVAASVAYVIL